ncbi:MAG: hypothetical protein JW940_28830, partial [Polyangiaceae bacterium]|nr:hypothetical protein [Polyangiaceae bacterium]
LCSVGMALAAALNVARASAQLGPNGTPLRTSRYSVDLHQGAVLAGNRSMGMAGAYVAIAEGVEGNLVNPVAPAVRSPWSRSHIDYDLGAGITWPATQRRSDWFNSGSDRTYLAASNPNEFVSLDVEGNLQLGPWGIGVAAALQQFELLRNTSAVPEATQGGLTSQFGVFRIDGARALADGQLLVGTGIRANSLSVVDGRLPDDGERQLFTTGGAGLAFGALWRPTGKPFRVGASAHTAVKSRADSGSTVKPDATGARVLERDTPDEIYLPDSVVLPWDASVGVAVQLGPRPLNPRWIDPSVERERKRQAIARRAAQRETEHAEYVARARANGARDAEAEAEWQTEQALRRQSDQIELEAAEAGIATTLESRERRMARGYVLLSASLGAFGPVDDAVGVESFLQRVVDRSGRRLVLMPQVGVETEVIPNWLKLRAGSYYEPTRFENQNAAARAHGTFGASSKLLPWSVFGVWPRDAWWRAQGAIDLAQRYFNWGFSVGIWH